MKLTPPRLVCSLVPGPLKKHHRASEHVVFEKFLTLIAPIFYSMFHLILGADSPDKTVESLTW